MKTQRLAVMALLFLAFAGCAGTTANTVPRQCVESKNGTAGSDPSLKDCGMDLPRAQTTDAP